MKRSGFAALGALAAVCGCAPAVDDARVGRAGAGPFEPTEELRAEILTVVQGVFDAIETGDEARLAEVMAPDAHMRSVRPGPGGTTVIATTSVSQMAELISGAPRTMLERMWEPEIRVSGGLASVWTAYDFYSGGAFSHCGVDAAHLMQEEGRWRIVSLTWSALQPPECEPHPEGPPSA